MYLAVIVILALVTAYYSIQWRKLRLLLPAALLGSLFAGIPFALPFGSPYILLYDAPAEWVVILIFQLTLGPIISTLFAQGASTTSKPPVDRILGFTAFSVCLELVTWRFGRLGYATWWNPFFSALYCASAFSAIWKVQTYYVRRRQTITPP